MPAPQPADVNSPVPGQSDLDAFMSGQKTAATSAGAAMSASAPAASGSTPAAAGSDTQLDAFMSQQNAAAAPQSPTSMTGSGMVQGALNAIPTVAAVGGGALSAVAGPEAIPFGAAAGGIAGASLKSFLEKMLLNKDPGTRGQFYSGLAKEGAEQGTGAMLGEAGAAAAPAVLNIGKKAFLEAAERTTNVPGDIIKNYFNAPERVKNLAVKYGGDVPSAANAMRLDFNQAITQTQGDMEKPALAVMADRTTQLSPAQTGDLVKKQVTDNVTQRYQPFIQAYKDLDAVAKTVPLADESRISFGNKLVNWATDEFPQGSGQWRTVKNYKDMFQASNTGSQFNSVIGSLQDDITAAYQAGKTKEGAFLVDLKDRAQGFLDDQVTSLATRLQRGTASPGEAQFLEQLGTQRGLQGEDLSKYAKSLASDYLKSKDTINADYSGFKSFMDDLTGQTKIKGRGTADFLQNLQAMPSEKLVAKMLDPQNSAALATMKQETPEVFKSIADAKVKQLAEKSMTEHGLLDVPTFQAQIMKLPQDTRNLIFSPQELKAIDGVVNSPKYQRFNQLREATMSMRTDLSDPASLIQAGRPGTNAARNLGELSLLTGKNMIQDVQTLATMEHFGQQSEPLTKLALKRGIDLSRPIAQFSKAVQQTAGPVAQQALGAQAAAPMVNRVSGLGSGGPQQ